MHSRSQSQPLYSKSPVPARRTNQDTPILAKLPRAPSDPFLDTTPVSRSFTSTITKSSSGNTAVPISASLSDTDPPSPTTPLGEAYDIFPPPFVDNGFEETEQQYMRTWTSPNLPDPEVLELLKVFPTFISRRTLPRFPPRPPPSRRLTDVEEGAEDDDPKNEIRVGTGQMWVSAQMRSEGWDGGWWVRFKLWWKRLFC